LVFTTIVPGEYSPRALTISGRACAVWDARSPIPMVAAATAILKDIYLSNTSARSNPNSTRLTGGFPIKYQPRPLTERLPRPPRRRDFSAATKEMFKTK
jgi:hypothetical protein